MDSQNFQNISSDNEIDLFYSTNMPNVTIQTWGGGGSGGSTTITTTGGTLGASGPQGGTWSNQSFYYNIPPPPLTVSGNTAEFNGKVTLNGKDLSEALENIEKRLAILTPNPKKLEKFAALQKAYENYKTLEALCQIDEDENEKS